MQELSQSHRQFLGDMRDHPQLQNDIDTYSIHDPILGYMGHQGHSFVVTAYSEKNKPEWNAD